MQSQDPDEWCFVDQGNGYFMLKHASGYFLDTVDESHGANVVVASDNGLARSNQHWRLQCFKSTAPEYDTCESLPEGYCHIVAKHSQQAINVDGFSHESGSNIHMWWETEADNDDWRFEHTSNGYVHVISKHSGLGLHADGDNKGNSIVQSDMKDEWCFIREDDDYYQVKNRRNGLGLDVYKLGTETGTNLIQWPYGDGQANRLFKLKCDNSNNEDPVPEDDGCGRLDGCYLRNIKTGVETYLQHWENRYDVSRYGINSDYTKYSIRCDVTGKMDQVDFFSGSVRHEEWNAPWWMNGDSGDYINDVDLLVDTSKCDQTFEVKVNGYVTNVLMSMAIGWMLSNLIFCLLHRKTWGDGDCFIKTYTMKMECMD